MFPFTKLNGERYYLNFMLIERIEMSGGLVLHFAQNNQTHRVKDEIEELDVLLNRYFIKLTKLNGDVFYLNHLLIELIEGNPTTIIFLTNANYHAVLENPEEIVQMINVKKGFNESTPFLTVL